MNLRPLHDWAVIRPSEADEMTAGGLYIPDTAKDKPHEGVVEAVGPGAYEDEKGKKKGEKKERRFVPTSVKPGDRVLYERYAGQTYKIGEAERVLVRERDILGILPEKQPAVITSQKSSGNPAAASSKKQGKMMNKAVTKPAGGSKVKKTTAKKAKKKQ